MEPSYWMQLTAAAWCFVYFAALFVSIMSKRLLLRIPPYLVGLSLIFFNAQARGQFVLEDAVAIAICAPAFTYLAIWFGKREANLE